MDRKIELDSLSEDAFQEVMTAVNTEVLKTAKEAQDKINELLLRFDVKCEISLAYQKITAPNQQFLDNLPPDTTPEAAPSEPEKPSKKKRAKKKKI
jgi:signal transduction histidine kinase